MKNIYADTTEQLCQRSHHMLSPTNDVNPLDTYIY